MNNFNKEEFFKTYYKEWIEIYKEGAIRNVTMSKYKMTLKWIQKLVPNLKLWIKL